MNRRARVGLVALVGLLTHCGGGNGAGPPNDAGARCGSRAGMRGLTHRSLKVAGLERTYLVYLPQSFDASKPIPFVFAFHGFTMSGLMMYDLTQYAALADSEGIGL